MVGVPQSAVVAILTRAPSSPGKSRLFAALGRPHDPSLLSALLMDTLDGARSSGLPCVIAVEPAAAVADVRGLVPPDVHVIAQQPGSLGDRMRAVMMGLFAGGAPAVVLIGSDLPGITGTLIQRAVSCLADDPESVVLGPAADGGYYLIAARHLPDLFDGIEWGSPGVLAATMAAASRRGLRIQVLETLPDVDTSDDLRAVTAPRTRAWVKTFLSSEP